MVAFNEADAERLEQRRLTAENEAMERVVAERRALIERAAVPLELDNRVAAAQAALRHFRIRELEAELAVVKTDLAAARRRTADHLELLRNADPLTDALLVVRRDGRDGEGWYDGVMSGATAHQLLQALTATPARLRKSPVLDAVEAARERRP